MRRVIRNADIQTLDVTLRLKDNNEFHRGCKNRHTIERIVGYATRIEIVASVLETLGFSCIRCLGLSTLTHRL